MRTTCSRTDGPAQLVLVTCGGAFDPVRHRYADNYVVVAAPGRLGHGPQRVTSASTTASAPGGTVAVSTVPADAAQSAGRGAGQ